ncbi:uncharacterized protein LOC111302762 [Durio zibethinus]|uniref:Uncharacterized protein LOC111302762 n=1 Tax=Durio zibethinus TaxID=66656 RepID=A0A6P5ZPK5_DURZI|nr:uncharacterized protein LOC111302762 [Durio zibethinus]
MCESVELEGKVYDLGGQVVAANSAPVIFHMAKEIGSELEEMDSHKLALIDSSTGKYQEIKVADDYVSMVALTLELQVSCRYHCCIQTFKSGVSLRIHFTFHRTKRRIQIELVYML